MNLIQSWLKLILYCLCCLCLFLIRGNTGNSNISHKRNQITENHSLIIYFYWGGVYFNLFTSLKIQVHKYVATGKNKRSLLDDCKLCPVLSAKTVYSSTNLWSEKINCKMLKMLPFELLYLLDFFVKPLKKITDTCKGRVVEF